VLEFTKHTPDFCRSLTLDRMQRLERMMREKIAEAAMVKRQYQEVLADWSRQLSETEAKR
jgi:hypothetical protein